MSSSSFGSSSSSPRSSAFLVYVPLCVCVLCVYVCVRERESMCEYERECGRCVCERERVCVCFARWMNVSVCVFLCERVCVRERKNVCVCDRERERERERGSCWLLPQTWILRVQRNQYETGERKNTLKKCAFFNRKENRDEILKLEENY